MDTAASQWLDRVTRTRDIDCYANAHTPAYRIPEAMKAFVKGRDGGCRFPGCGARAEVCDIDLRQRRGHRASRAS